MKTERKNIYSVPEGYFDNLQKRLEMIPASNPIVEEEKGDNVISVSVWSKIKPYFALAACMALSFVIGSRLLNKTTPRTTEELTAYEQFIYSDMIPVTDPHLAYGAPTTEADEISQEELTNYLIESGTSAELISYIKNESNENNK